MKLNNILTITLFLVATAVVGQKYVTKTGSIKFYSDTPVEKIEAYNHQVNAALDTKTGDFVFKVLMKSFIFEKALMQEHFNESYVESDIYPNATFLGKIPNTDEIDFQKAGTYDAAVEGKLTIHGVTKDIKEKGTLVISDGDIMAISVFQILLSDYNVKIPAAITDKISETIDITVEVTMKMVQ